MCCLGNRSFWGGGGRGLEYFLWFFHALLHQPPTDATGNPHHLCLVSYRIPEGFTPEVSPHGNDKTMKPFYPTLPSTKAGIESQSKLHGPKQVLAIVSREIGGVQHASSPCELPRNERQVLYIHSKSKASSVLSQGGVIDPLADQIFAMMQSAKVGDSLGHFVRETRPSPEPAFVLACDRQLDDLVRFCAIPDGFSVLTVDPTFNLGDFDVTPTTYRHRLFISTHSGNHSCWSSSQVGRFKSLWN